GARLPPARGERPPPVGPAVPHEPGRDGLHLRGADRPRCGPGGSQLPGGAPRPPGSEAERRGRLPDEHPRPLPLRAPLLRGPGRGAAHGGGVEPADGGGPAGGVLRRARRVPPPLLGVQAPLLPDEPALLQLPLHLRLPLQHRAVRPGPSRGAGLRPAVRRLAPGHGPDDRGGAGPAPPGRGPHPARLLGGGGPAGRGRCGAVLGAWLATGDEVRRGGAPSRRRDLWSHPTALAPPRNSAGSWPASTGKATRPTRPSLAPTTSAPSPW